MVLNLYPYNPGHLMVVPYRRVSELEDLTEDESAELMAFTQKAIRVMKAVSRPHGFNVGLNLGTSAGGSLAEHLHMHVVPRWGGDANFITIIGGSKVIPQLLRDTRQLLATEWDKRSERLLSDDPRGLREALEAGGQGRATPGPDSRQRHHPRHCRFGAGSARRCSRSGSCSGDRCAVFVFVLADMLDGAMARERGGGTRFGAVLDATCDRISDGAIFCGLLWWAAFGREQRRTGRRDDDLPGRRRRSSPTSRPAPRPADCPATAG